MQLEYEETVVDFDAGFESVESLLQVFPQGGEFPGTDLHELTGTVTAIHRIQDRVAAVDKLADETEWDWWRDGGLRFILDTGWDLIVHRAATEVRMRAGARGAVEPDPLPRHSYQENQKRRYEFNRREVPLDHGY